MESIAILILAAGLGKRMGSEIPKVLVQTDEGALIHHVLRSCAPLAPERLLVVTGFEASAVEQAISSGAKQWNYDRTNAQFALQEQQLGTGHAVQCAMPLLKDFTGTVLILYGDIPLLTSDTLSALISRHRASNATLTLVSALTPHPAAYGRVVRDAAGEIKQIVEAKDCSEAQLLINEINSGIYAVDSSYLAPAVESLKNDNKQEEYYLTDIVGRAVSEGQSVASLVVPDLTEVQGVNTPLDLTLVNQTLKNRRIEKLIAKGVVFVDPNTVYISPQAEIGDDISFGPNVQILGSSRIHDGVIFDGTAYILDSSIDCGAHIRLGVRMEGASVGKQAVVGPFAHLRPGTVLEQKTKIGNFVETKNAHVQAGAKASHLTYLGDCEIGEEANIGAGTITCNYDGTNKHRTVIGKGAFVGSNTSLLAPLTIGEDACVGAGSAISRDVPDKALALTRPEQKTIDNWQQRKKKKGKDGS